MRKNIIKIDERFNYLFVDAAEAKMVEELIAYLTFGIEPETTPAMWQDVEKFIRFAKRDEWRLSLEERNNAEGAILSYRIKYIVRHLKKTEIMEILNKFFAEPDEKHPHETLNSLLAKKFHTDIDNFILVQEKRVVGVKDLEKFNEIFDYPAWVEFDEEATDVIYKKILNNELTDEQIDYFFGASDDLKEYDKLYPVVKHVLLTTKNAHTYWIAGDLLNCIWVAASDDEKTQKWFRDEIFEIFWLRVGSVWPMKNKNLIELEQDDDARILFDAISWLDCLTDLKERLPELPKDYKLLKSYRDPDEFSEHVELFLRACKDDDPYEAETCFNELISLTAKDEEVKKLKELYEKDFEKLMRDGVMDGREKVVLKFASAGVKSAERYVAKIKRERKNVAKLVK